MTAAAELIKLTASTHASCWEDDKKKSKSIFFPFTYRNTIIAWRYSVIMQLHQRLSLS